MKNIFNILLWLLSAINLLNAQEKSDKPNIVILFADDISARELPIYGSTVWTAPSSETTSDVNYRAKTPALDDLAQRGCWVTNPWAATVCNPSRAMMMTGRYAYQTKWWNNKDKGFGPDENGQIGTWPVYMSSPLLMGKIAQESGYATFWAGKTQMAGSWEKHGFDEGCLTPGGLKDKDNPYTDFKHIYKKVDGKRVMLNADTQQPCDTYLQHGWYWYPHVKLMNHPSAPNEIVWWPNTPESKKSFGAATYGPDVELDFVFDFMERKHDEGQPFLIYHTSHLGHDAFNWLDPEYKKWKKSKWPNTPIVTWDGKQYKRITPKITGDNGQYETHGTVTDPGIHHHINYLDYQVWLYQQKFEELNIEDNTIFIFSADNGTSGYGKNKGIQQRGSHVPLIIYAPGLTKQGEQDILVSLADIVPTLAEVMGFQFPDDYKLDGISLAPYLFGEAQTHRQWLYTYRGPEQLVRSAKLLKDGTDKWWDVTNNPDDLTSYQPIKIWETTSDAYKQEKEDLLSVLPKYDLYYDAYNAPGISKQPKKRPWYSRKSKADKVYE
ncbi:MAG: sulfatase-like hydrolase/transferase [Bacteroidota bacterium]